MARHRTLVRLSRALRFVAVVVAAAAGTTALFEADLGRGLVMPGWKVAAAPPALYLALALVTLRHLPLDRRVGWALAACGVNVALALASAITLSLMHPMSLEGALLRSLWTYVPGPAIHLFAAPLALLAWRSRVIPLRAFLRAGRSASARAARPPAPPLPTTTPNWDAVLRPSSVPAWTAGSGPSAFERTGMDVAVLEMPEEAVTPVVNVSALPSLPPPPSPRPVVVVEAPPPVTISVPVKAPPVAAPAPVATPPPVADEPMVRVPFARIAAQLPPDAFTLPPERLAESLREPHVLLVPRRLVVPQLGEGAVEIAWTNIEEQFPELAFALPPSEVRKRFPGWVLSLPMDEVVRQIPADLLRLEAPAADLSEIGQFPAPFNPGPPAPEPAAEPEPPMPPPSTIVEPPAPAPLPAATVVVASEPPVPVAPAVEEATPEPAVAAPVAAAEVVDEESEALARTLALGLTSLGAFDWQTRRVGGRPLVCFVPPALARAAIDELAARAAPLLERLAGWEVEQITVRTTRVACVLTPLDSHGCLAVAARRNGPVAMLELQSARAGRTTGVVPAIPAPSVALTPVTTAPVNGGNGHRRLDEAARALAAFGPVAFSVAEAEGAAPSVYVFSGRDDSLLAGVARAVHEALVAGHDQDALGRLESVELRRGRERAVVRPLRGQAGGPAILAAVGEVALAGRAHRAVARAAALLEAR